MKKNILNPYQVTLSKCLLVLALVFFNTLSKSQTLQRQSIASGGTYMLNDGTLIQQTVGQSYATDPLYNNEITYRPGFQQPVFKIKLIQSAISLNVFPNPASRLVTIQSVETLADVLIQVADMTGKLLIHEKISEFKTYSFNCDQWANGFYMIAVSDGKKRQYSSKLIILK